METFRQVCVQPSGADNVSLAVFAAERRLCSSRYLPAAGPTSMPAVPTICSNSCFSISNLLVSEICFLLFSLYYYWYSIIHSLFHSRLKSFLFCKSSLPQPFLFLLQDSLYGFPRLFTVTSEHIRLYTFYFFSVFTLF